MFIRGWALINFYYPSGLALIRSGHLFEVGSLSTFLAVRVGACSKWALNCGWQWALINFFDHQGGILFEVGHLFK